MTQFPLFNALLPTLGNVRARLAPAWRSTGRIAGNGRIIVHNANGSNHRCDSRCTHATGDKCECSCGGRNHGIYR
jgi:hypothetical protein